MNKNVRDNDNYELIKRVYYIEAKIDYKIKKTLKI